jgi:Xaa-Pro dipeptidase
MITRRSFLKIGGLTVAASGWVSRLFGNTAAVETPSLQNMVADVKPLAAQDYAARIEKAKRLIAENKLDGLFLEGGTNLQYFTKVNWWRSERTFGAVFSLKRDPVWICPAFERKRAEELIPEGQEIRTWEEHESPYILIGGIMKDLGAGGGRLGLDPSMRHFIYYGLRKEVPGLELADGAAVTEGCRGVKTAKEVAYMDLANKITKLAFREGFKQVREGMSPRDLAAAISEAHQKTGVSGGGSPLRMRRRRLPVGCHPDRLFRAADRPATACLGSRQKGPGRGAQGGPARSDLRVGRRRGPQGHRGCRVRSGL